MIIAIVGAGLAGLTAGKILAQKGHEVIVLEKSRGFGGRLSTRYAGKDLDVKLDHGTPYLEANGESFQLFINELVDKGVLAPWTDSFGFHNEEGFFESHPSREMKTVYAAPNGMNSVGKYLSRWVDVRNNTHVSGITMVAPGSKWKRPWILNMTDSSVLEADVLILATPAIQASGLLQTAQDETPVRALHALTSTIKYDATFTMMLGYGEMDIPGWKGVYCQNDVIGFISNESSKRNNQELTIVAQTNKQFSYTYRDVDPAVVKTRMSDALSQILGKWAGVPKWSQLHFWRYAHASNSLKQHFLESSQEEAPLAIIGDYLGGNSMESAYVSGLKLAEYWSEKLSVK
ncbi:MAG: NAD(P)-binding protein [Balneolales bacterium]|nr:NAD(P)-binding protein [Balneolales bacterium]